MKLFLFFICLSFAFSQNWGFGVGFNNSVVTQDYYIKNANGYIFSLEHRSRFTETFTLHNYIS